MTGGGAHDDRGVLRMTEDGGFCWGSALVNPCPRQRLSATSLMSFLSIPSLMSKKETKETEEA
jgi:hypothetical protein